MLNIAVIMGRLTKDPELRQTPNNVSTATFSVAVDRDYKKDGQEKDTDFLDVVAWRGTAEFICNNFSKGQMITIIGRLQKRSYEDTNGNKRNVVEIIADNVYFCGPKPQQDDTATFDNFNTGQFAPFPNNGFIQPQQPSQFQQFPGQSMQQQPTMMQPQFQQPNIQSAPTVPPYTQAPSQQMQQTATPQSAPVGTGMTYNPNDWTSLDDAGDLPF